MNSRLKHLYRYLIENRKHEVDDWYEGYREFHQQVEEVRKRLQSGEKLSSIAGNEEGRTFLKKLLFDEYNGIASRGQSTLSHENFGRYIAEPEFLTALEGFILEPVKETYDTFANAWQEAARRHGANNNWLLINRVAAACTLDVSTTADSGKFNQVFSWLIKEEVIREYPGEASGDWFSKNLFLMEAIKEVFQDELANQKTDRFLLSQFVWVMYVHLANPFSLKKQIVKYGAPGTGKTYQALQQTELLFDIWKEEFAPKSDLTHDSQISMVQFHPSFSYEDFMEGLRPDLDGRLMLQNGIFKEFCREAGQWELDYHQLDQKPKGKGGKDKTFDERDKLSIEDLLPYRDQLADPRWDHVFDTSDKKKLVADAIPPFFFIIDEVNRAELSRVFGELMYCLEYRGIKGAVRTQYSNLNNSQTGMLHTRQGYKFFIPTNIYLIGTMNTLDRSVESFDFALRRRFCWEEVAPDTGVLSYHLAQHCKEWAPLAEDLSKLNSMIAVEPLLGHDYQIGHAYLMKLKYPESLTVREVRQRVWEDSILPLIQEYLRGAGTGKESELIKSLGKKFGV